MRKRITSLLLVLFVGACAMPATHIYSLNMPLEKKPSAASSDASVAVVMSSPRYLSQPYIAYRSSPYQLTISRYAKWDSPPEEITRDAFRDSLSALFKDVRTSSLVPGGAYSLKVALKRFERYDEGDSSFAEVAFEVNLFSPEGKNLYQDSFAKKIKLEDRSFVSLAKGLTSALGEGTQEVKGNIARAMKR